MGFHYSFELIRPKKEKCLVSGYPTDPNILGPSQTFEALCDIMSIYFTFLKDFYTFSIQKSFYKKSLPTYLP